MFKKNLSIAIVAIFVPIFFLGIVNSQTLERGGIEEIIVTAQKTDENIQDVKRKVRYDVLYIKKMCPFLDMKVIALTALTVIFKTGR